VPLAPAASASSWRLFASSEEEDKKEEGHKPPSGHGVQVKEEELTEEMKQERDMFLKLREHQKEAPRLTNAEEVRTLLSRNSGHGVISTAGEDGFPNGGVVAFGLSDDGLPTFSFSGLSGHTRDVLRDPRCTLTVTADSFKGMSDARVALSGVLERATDEDTRAKMKEVYLAKHPDHFWAEFGDFSFFQMKEIKSVRYVGGFARAGDVTAEDYVAAKPDIMASFMDHVCNHMNDDHADAVKAITQSAVPMPPIDEASMVSFDRLGMLMKVKFTRSGEVLKVRVPFPREAQDRKDIKTLIVEMTQAAQ